MLDKDKNQVKVSLVTIATGQYKQFVPEFLESARRFIDADVYLLSDKKITHARTKHIRTKHLGFPRMPLLRFETIYQHKDKIEGDYIYMVDIDAKFKIHVDYKILDERVATLHRNVMRLRKDFNYESRPESAAYIRPDEGEKYYACGFVGGTRKEFFKMAKTISTNIRKDIDKGIRAVWGDESHLNRYLIDNPPTKVLPPSYMCPENSKYFRPIIQHRDKDFKSENIHSIKRYLKIDPKEYGNLNNRT